jgi:CelD/BcsL family acetyltransferase involved in cellulose biosynthesis
VLAVFERANHLVGIAPWYLRRSGTEGRVLEFLGSGEVASDYLGLICRPDLAEAVADRLAQWLLHASQYDGPERWDLLKLTSVAADDQPTALLVDRLAADAGAVHRRRSPCCWRIALPCTWDQYLACLSKGHRKQVRRAEKNIFETGRAVLHTVENAGQLPEAMDVLMALHQRRRQRLGDSGRFASEQFAAFHRDVARRMLDRGQLQLHWLELDGDALPISATCVSSLK